MHIDRRPDYTLICEHADYLAEQFARTAITDTSTATDYSPGATMISDEDSVTKPVRVRLLKRPTVCQQQSGQHNVAKLEVKSQLALWLRIQADLHAKKLATRSEEVVRKCHG